MWIEITRDLVQPPVDWRGTDADWAAAGNGSGDGVLRLDGAGGTARWVSPSFELSKGDLYAFEFSGRLLDDGEVTIALSPADDDRRAGTTLRESSFSGPGAVRAGFALLPRDDGRYRLEYHRGGDGGEASVRLSAPTVVVRTLRDAAPPAAPPAGTELAGWGPLRRAVHRLCKRHRLFNAFVAALEMRLGHEEILSMPMYTALCPTGQCNALCGFCAVSVNRTGEVTDTRRDGIIKRELPWAELGRFLAPTIDTIYLYGLEGNGEPTLYGHFDELLGLMTSRGARTYLITNGTQITPERMPVLNTLESITFSLNAACPETHRQVMKIRDWDRVIATIRRVIESRGTGANPVVYLSFVVHHDNVHELGDFLRFAEHDLEGDVIVIRPLSELGSELGVNEDLRALTPFESDVRDALDAAAEYIHDVPRRRIPGRGTPARIVLDPESFIAVRHDPVDRIVMPKGFEDRLLAPRRQSWTARAPDLAWRWRLDTLQLHRDGGGAGETVYDSAAIPVEPGRRLTVRCRARISGAPVAVSVRTGADREIGRLVLDPDGAGMTGHQAVIDTGAADAVRLAIVQLGGTIDAAIDFERLRTPAPAPGRGFTLPYPRRWQRDHADVAARWDGSALRLGWHGPAQDELYKCFSVPCAPHRTVEVPVTVEVRHGALSIGVIAEDLTSRMAEFAFDEGRHETVLRFDSGANTRLRIALGARAAGALEAVIDWGTAIDGPPARNPAMLSADADRLSEHVPAGAAVPWRPRLPEPTHWHDFGIPAGARWQDRTLSLDYAGAPGPYLYGCTDVPVVAGDELALAADIDVARGTLGIGVLDESRQRWIDSATFRPGRHRARLRVATGGNSRVHVILFSDAPQPLRATVDWSRAIGTGRAAGDAPPRAAVAARRARTARYYCQKPWTDLSSFTVDGRMDVCCIATGGSQQRYALGNLRTQSFQEVWNGARMREFRRTVNAEAKLDPCQRCPMAYAYQGPFFDRGYVAEQVRLWLARRLGGRRPASARLAAGLHAAIMAGGDFLLFRGFRK